jgi:hypothetical protein
MVFNAVYYKTMNRSQLVAFEVYDAIDKSSRYMEYTSLVLGDSVARQIFNPEYQEESNEICYMATNQAITPAGNYILLRNYLHNNQQVKKVYYVARPDSLQSGVNFTYTYSYFITPLYKEPFWEYLDYETRERIDRVFGSLWTRHEFPKWMLAKYPKLLEWYNEGLSEIWNHRWSKQEMPDMSVTYIANMKQLCEENDIEFILLSPPLPEGYDEDNKDKLYEKLIAAGEENLINAYENSVRYIDNEKFVDGVHMKQAFLVSHREEIRDKMIK